MFFQFKIQLKHAIAPPVWRKLMLQKNITFEEFHQIIQLVMGWENRHEYRFLVRDQNLLSKIGQVEKIKNQNLSVLNKAQLCLSDYFSDQQKSLVYVYDLENEWVHTVHLENTIENHDCPLEILGGQGACPPENSGGIWAYQRVKEFVKNPEKPEWHEVMWEMFGHLLEEDFDPNDFDLELVQQKLMKWYSENKSQ